MFCLFSFSSFFSRCVSTSPSVWTITVTQSEQDRSCILLVQMQRRSGTFVWVHVVLQVRDSQDNSQQPVIVCTNQVLRWVLNTKPYCALLFFLCFCRHRRCRRLIYSVHWRKVKQTNRLHYLMRNDLFLCAWKKEPNTKINQKAAPLKQRRKSERWRKK